MKSPLKASGSCPFLVMPKIVRDSSNLKTVAIKEIKKSTALYKSLKQFSYIFSLPNLGWWNSIYHYNFISLIF